MPALRGKRADSTDLDGDAGEIREAAERITRQRDRSLVERARMRFHEVREIKIADEFIEDDAFTENAAAQSFRPLSTNLERRYGSFEGYLTRWRAEQHPDSDDAERILERTIRYELAPLPDGTYRRRVLRAAFEETFASLLQSDSLGALARVRCPTLTCKRHARGSGTGPT